MSKLKLFLDFDNCITNSLKAFVDTYNILYRFQPDFKPATYDVKQYNLKDQCPLVNHVDDIFSNKKFFKNLRFINFNTKEVLKELSKDFDIIICTIGTPMNVALKSMWLSQNLPFVEQYCLVTNNYENRECVMNKSLVNMSGSTIFIDDMPDNLNSSNAKYKILFGKEYLWNKSDNPAHIKCLDWSAVYDRCMKIKDKEISKELPRRQISMGLEK